MDNIHQPSAYDENFLLREYNRETGKSKRSEYSLGTYFRLNKETGEVEVYFKIKDRLFSQNKPLLETKNWSDVVQWCASHEIEMK